VGVFVKHTSCDKCGSSDGLAVYDDDSMYCWVCNYTVPSKEYLQDIQESKSKVQVKSKGESKLNQVVQSTKPAISQEEIQEIKDVTSTKCNSFRGLRDDVTTYFGVRHAFNEEGEVIEQYYPCTQDGGLVGFKIRGVPKSFHSTGRTGADCELFGAFRFNRGGKYILLVEGELCMLSAYQMLKEYRESKGSDYETAVVSPTTGAQSAKQIAANYKFLDSFENIILCMDNDKAGQEAIDKLLPVLPKGKVKIMEMRHKDPNEYLCKGESKKFIQDFYASKARVPAGVLPSDQLYDLMMSQIGMPRLPFPRFMGSLNDFFRGGIPTGHIVNIAAATSLGKTTLVNELIYYWIFNSPYRVGIVSMELNSGQYTEALLSRHVGRKLALIESDEEKLEYLSRPSVQEKAQELLKDSNGDPRFYLLDNRDASVQEIQDTIEELVISCGCRVIVIDVLQDIIAALSNEEQELFLKWSKSIIKSHNIIMIYVNHTRKTRSGENAADDESSIHGSSSIIKSASVNIMLKRDKMSPCEYTRNKTEILVHKNRVYGITGSAGAVYYDNESHTLHNYDEYMREHNLLEF
jgi:archaellum biogenesis ATPase FlaH